VMPYLDDALRALDGLDDAEALRLAGEAHYQAGRLAPAIEAWRRVPRAAPPGALDLWYAERLAHALYLAGRYEESAHEYEAVGQRRGAAAAWTAAKDGERALAHLLALLEQAPGDGALLEEAVTAARLTSEERRLERGLAALPANDPAAQAAHVRVRARLLVLLAEHVAAATLLREARGALAGADAAHVGAALARTLLLTPGLGEPGRDEAARALLDAAAAAPDAAEVAALMTTMAQQDFAAAPGAWPDARPLERGVAVLQALARTAPDDPLVLSNLGNMLRLAGRGAEAVAALEAACRAAPGDAAVTNDLGLALLAAGDRVAARAAFERAVEEDAGLAAARQNLARLLADAGQTAQAREQLAAAEAASRHAGQPWLLYRFLALRAWRLETAGR
jgi:tetratricopeptide (TPR) repeat protein